MRSWRRSSAAVAVVTALVSACLALAAPSASAAQGCSTIPSFCAWTGYYLQGSVITINDPEPGSLLGGRCYDLRETRLSAANYTGLTAVMHADRNCGLLITSTLIPGQLVNQTLPFQSVSFLPI